MGMEVRMWLEMERRTMEEMEMEGWIRIGMTEKETQMERLTVRRTGMRTGGLVRLTGVSQGWIWMEKSHFPSQWWSSR